MAFIHKKKFEGKPIENNEWGAFVSKNKIDGAQWKMCFEEDPKTNWRKLKISADGKVSNKANYWTAWNGERLADTSHLKIMKEYRPDLYDFVIDRCEFAQEFLW